MTMGSVIYDSNFSVPMHVHRPTMDSLAGGDEIVCATCGKPLIVVCPDGHDDALDRVRYAKIVTRATAHAPPPRKVSGHPGHLPRRRLHEAADAAEQRRQRTTADKVRASLDAGVEEGEA